MTFDNIINNKYAGEIFQMLPPACLVLGANVRRTIVSEELNELKESIVSLRGIGEGIEGSGILQALLVRPVTNDNNAITEPLHETESKFQLICGQKRFLAAKALDLPAIPCLIDRRDASARTEKGSVDAVTRLLQLTENAQRDAPPPLEEAEALLETMREMRLSVRDAARLLGKNKGYIENRLRLLKMEPDVQRMVSLRKDTIPHAYYIAQVTDEALRAKLISAVLHEQIGVREVRRRIEAVNNEKSDEKSGSDEKSEVVADAPMQSDAPTVTGDILESYTPPAPGRDYLRQNLRPAVSLLAQAVRYIDPSHMTPTQRKNLHVELDLLRRQIEVLETHLKS